VQPTIVDGSSGNGIPRKLKPRLEDSVRQVRDGHATSTKAVVPDGCHLIPEQAAVGQSTLLQDVVILIDDVGIRAGAENRQAFWYNSNVIDCDFPDAVSEVRREFHIWKS